MKFANIFVNALSILFLFGALRSAVNLITFIGILIKYAGSNSSPFEGLAGLGVIMGIPIHTFLLLIYLALSYGIFKRKILAHILTTAACIAIACYYIYLILIFFSLNSTNPYLNVKYLPEVINLFIIPLISIIISYFMLFNKPVRDQFYKK